jgi:hypothetical protein
MSTYKGYSPSHQAQPFLQTDATEIGNFELCMMLNPGTTGTVSPAADTANAKFVGVSVNRGPVKPERFLDTIGEADEDAVVCDIGGAVLDVDVTDNLSGDEAGQIVKAAGRRSVTIDAAGTGNVPCGVIVKVLATGAGTSRARIQCSAYAHWN